MTDDSALLRLPTVAKNHILYFCDYMEIARLRNVCHTLRNHIDENKPDAHVKEVYLGDRKYADIFFKSDNNSRIWIGYRKAESGSTVVCRSHMGSHPVKTISGLDLMDALIQDFKIYLRHLKSPLRKFKLYEICCDLLIQIMRSQPPQSRIFPLKVDKLEMHGLSEAQILATLPLFDANHLKDLKIETGALGVFQELFESEHWKNAKKISTSLLKISNVRQISHLEEFNGFISMVTATDVEFLKNTFISSPHFKWCHIVTDVDIDVLSIKETFGAQSLDLVEGIMNLWFFHISNDTNKALLVRVTLKKILEIERIHRSKVVPGAVIIY